MSSDQSSRFLPLSVPVLNGNEEAYVLEAVRSGWLSTAGPFVERFEALVREITGAAHAVATVTGTEALHLGLRAAGVCPGDLVIVPTLTFIATANAVSYCGATPVLAGCDRYMNLDADSVERFFVQRCRRGDDGVAVETSSGRPVRAIVPVHVFGNPADMVRLLDVASAFGAVVVEDAAESLGSTWTDGPLAGRATGTVGQGGALSFNGNKIVTAGGGGCYVTNDAAVAERVLHLTKIAKTDEVRYWHDEVGYNDRLTNLPAALAVAQLEQLGRFVEAKRANYTLYADALDGIDGVSLLGAPEGTSPNHWFYSILVEPEEFAMDRERLMGVLAEQRIQSRPVWGLVHMQRPYASAPRWEVDSAVWFWERVLNIPCSSDLTAEDIERVASAIRAAGKGR
jgi:perosamine synthetase